MIRCDVTRIIANYFIYASIISTSTRPRSISRLTSIILSCFDPFVSNKFQKKKKENKTKWKRRRRRTKRREGNGTESNVRVTFES